MTSDGLFDNADKTTGLFGQGIFPPTSRYLRDHSFLTMRTETL